MIAAHITYPIEQDYATLELPFPGASYTVVITQTIEHESVLNRYTAYLVDGVHTLHHFVTAEQDDPALVYAAACEVAFGLWLASKEPDGD